MTSRPHTCWKRKGLPIAGCLLIAAGVGFVIYQGQKPAVSPITSSTADTYPIPDLQDPAISFDTLRYTADTGGNENTRAQSIVWLDQQSRSMQPLSPRQETWMFAMLQSGGHPQWDKDYKFWFFNSALNTLHAGPNQENLTRLLMHLAVNDPEKTMRLYALQHIRLQRGEGRLIGPLADKVYATMNEQLASDPETAGTLIESLLAWDRSEDRNHSEIITRAAQIAADSARTVDVRVTALHASGSAALALARDLAEDSSQPIQVRKASIALIGSYGQISDIEDLARISSGNSRLAQAAGPASKAINLRYTK